MSESIVEPTADPAFTCPRRVEDGGFGVASVDALGDDALDRWEIRSWPDAPGIINSGVRACSYCGSMHPDDFMQAILDGHEVGPTDKSYKAYLEYVPSRESRGKFYFQHLSDDQRREFIELLNAGAMNVGYPGHFYALPYFAKRAER